jgi:glycosyltransferase involved in cell wall biosynthesis
VQRYNIIIPIYNEEDNIKLIYDQIYNLDLYNKIQITFVDDGSTDDSLVVIKKIANKDRSVDFISFSKNFGHQIALSAGIDSSTADATIMMDADLQHPVECIPEMIKKFNNKNDIVQMVKIKQGKRNIFIRLFSFLFYFLFRQFSNINLSNNVSDFRLISKKVCEQLKLINEKERFLRGLVQWVGFKYTEVFYHPSQRKFGKSKYGFFKLIKLASFGVFSFSTIPLRMSLYIGTSLSFLSFLYGSYAIINKLILKKTVPVGYTDLIVFITFIGGIQLIFLGIIGLYIIKIFDQVRDRPLYIINEKKIND